MYHIKKKKLHYAWVVCFGCALMYFCTCGLSCNVFSVYSPFIMELRNYTKTQISLISSFRSLFSMIAIFMTGNYYGKLKLKQGMLVAGLICAAGYLVYGLAKTYPVYLIGSALVGYGYGLGAMVPISMILEHWFYRDRTLAVSLVSAASGLATIGVPSLITAVIERFGMSFSFMLEGGVMMVLVFLSWLLIRDNPSDLSIKAFGEKEEKENEELRKAAVRSGDAIETSKKKELSKTWWIVLYFMVVVSTSFNSAGWSHLSMLISTEGYEPGTVALALSVCGAMLMLGKLVFGIIAGKITLFKTSMIFGIACVLSTAACCIISIGKPVLYTVVGVFGASLTLISVGIVAWIGDWARPEEYTARTRKFQLLYSAGGLAMNLLPGIMADRCGGSYVPFYAFAAVCALIVLIIVWMTYRKIMGENT